jgi:hypothetical protein
MKIVSEYEDLNGAGNGTRTRDPQLGKLNRNGFSIRPNCPDWGRFLSSSENSLGKHFAP